MDSPTRPLYSRIRSTRVGILLEGTEMFGIGFQEMLVILVVVLIFFGPKRLPDLAKSLGKGIAEFKKASEEVRRGIDEAVREESTEPPASPAKPASTPDEGGAPSETGASDPQHTSPKG
jgi:sec-independent protein translocase protein TatA